MMLFFTDGIARGAAYAGVPCTWLSKCGLFVPL